MSNDILTLKKWLVGRTITKVYREGGVLALDFEDDTSLIVYTEVFAKGVAEQLTKEKG